MFADNESVVTSGTIPHSALGEHWNVLSHHFVHEAVAGCILSMFQERKIQPMF